MKNGDLILLDFTAKVKDTGDLIETTIEEEGKKIGEFDEDFVFKPRLVAVGAGWELKGLDEALERAEVGEAVNIDIRFSTDPDSQSIAIVYSIDPFPSTNVEEILGSIFKDFCIGK